VTGRKRLVLGFVNDKDLEPIKKELSAIGDAEFYFTRPSVSRGLPPEELAAEMEPLKGRVFDSVEAALATAGDDAAANDMIFVGGSTFVVADFLASRASNYEKY
jgi:dihydrofolate synthase/folylpolyglutamate synthase